ncbi:unnamed protein product [Caenorhabditis sp. 36 PRJEB53466]|nr:unnamed protein product [Caenorhabditis sp. 36 PRJEB53466]
MAEKTDNLDELFKDRYTENDERYKKMSEEGFEKVIVVHPWNPRRDNNYRGRGGGGGRGGYRGGGGWNNPRGGSRGGWNNHGGGDRQPWRGGGGDRKRQYN